MTLETFNKIKPHIDVLELIFVSNDSGYGKNIFNKMLELQKEYNPNPRPTDSSCGACVLELFKDVYRHYKRNEERYANG